MIITFWALVILLTFWYLGVLGYIYHVFAFRFPKDITISMLLVSIMIIVPLSLICVSYVAEYYGKVF